eukprot:6684328-Pyramimonas_sp.AAC.1
MRTRTRIFLSPPPKRCSSRARPAGDAEVPRTSGGGGRRWRRGREDPAVFGGRVPPAVLSAGDRAPDVQRAARDRGVPRRAHGGQPPSRGRRAHSAF